MSCLLDTQQLNSPIDSFIIFHPDTVIILDHEIMDHLYITWYFSWEGYEKCNLKYAILNEEMFDEQVLFLQG